MSTTGTASAIPDNLYRYSDRCVRVVRDLQLWVSGVLEPALQSYLRGAASQQDGVNVDIGAASSRSGVIENDLPGQLASTYCTDSDVRNIGIAFQEAGTVGNLSGLHRPAGSTPVFSTDKEIERQYQLADIYNRYFGSAPRGSQRAELHVEPTSGDYGIIIARFFITSHDAAFRTLLGDNRKFSTDPSAGFRIALAWNTATGEVTYTITPSTDKMNLTGHNILVPARPIKDRGANAIYPSRGMDGSYRFTYSGLNSVLDAFSVNGDIGIKLGDGHTAVRINGDAYPNFEVIQYHGGYPPRFLAQSPAHNSGIPFADSGVNSIPGWPGGHRDESWTDGIKVPSSKSPVSDPSIHIWDEPNPSPQPPTMY